MARAWVHQDDKQVKKRGAAKASWYASWLDPDGKRRCKSFGPGSRGRARAEEHARRVEGQLGAGTYESPRHKSWADFRADYEENVLGGLGARTQAETRHALAQFERLMRPGPVHRIGSKTLCDYAARRRAERGQRPGSTVSPATINKELRHLKAVFRKAQKWGYLTRAPEVEFLKEDRKLPAYVPPEHFVALYEACGSATIPDRLAWPAADWWRGLLVTAYLTGWRIGQILALRRSDVDLEEGTALTRAEDNKGRRDQLVVLHALVIDHLRALRGFTPTFFPWPHARKLLWGQFQRLQEAAGVKPAGDKPAYGFHDLRRGFATMNADRLTPDALQRLMQHQDYQTTQRYINMARQLRPSAENLYVPDVRSPARCGEG